MQLSYRGQNYTHIHAEVPVTEQSFNGQFLGVSSTLSTAYRAGISNSTVPLTYRGQHYLSNR